MRERLVVANWKMNGNRAQNERWTEVFRAKAADLSCRAVVCAPSVYLATLPVDAHFELGAQDVNENAKGAFTGEVSAAMLADLGVRWCIVGHSERRTLYGDTDQRVAKKVRALVEAGVRPIVCVGETRAEREAGATEVHVRLSAPPFTDPCFFGTDVDSKENLIAAHHSVEEIGKIIGADSIGFLSLEACDKLAADSHCGFCKGCFCGKYPVDPPLVTEKNKFDQPIHGGKVQDDD